MKTVKVHPKFIRPENPSWIDKIKFFFNLDPLPVTVSFEVYPPQDLDITKDPQDRYILGGNWTIQLDEILEYRRLRSYLRKLIQDPDLEIEMDLSECTPSPYSFRGIIEKILKSL